MIRPGRKFCVALAMILACAALAAQTPRPFPAPNQPAAPAAPGSQQARPVPPAASVPVSKATPEPDVPSEAMLGAPIYPNAQFIASYDAGRGQRFYLFGVSSGFLDMVTYYRTALKQKGNELFETPPTHQFEIGRFREETMAFPPSVTIKDYTFGGSAGYPNPRRGAQPARFATVIQIVPAPPGTQQN